MIHSQKTYLTIFKVQDFWPILLKKSCIYLFYDLDILKAPI